MIAVLQKKRDGVLGQEDNKQKMIRSMKKICFIRKCAAILVLSVSSIVSVFAQGAVIGYADGHEWIINNQYTLFPTNMQLIKLTHVIATSMGSYTGGNLSINELPSIWDAPQLSEICSFARNAKQ